MPAGDHQGVPVAFQPGEPGLAVPDGSLGARDGHLGDPEPARVLLALRVELAERPVEAALDRARAAVGAADGCLEPVPQRSLVARQVVHLVVADGRGGAEELLRRDAGQLGEQLVGAGGIRDRLPVEDQPDGAPAAAEILEDAPDPGPLQVVLHEVELDRGTSFLAGVPAAQAVDLRPARGDAPEEPDLERALERRLAGLVRAPDDREPGRQLEVQVPVDPEVANPDPRDPHSATSCPSSIRWASRRASRSSSDSSSRSLASASAMDASRSRTSAPAIVSGGGRGPSGSAAAEASRTRSRKKRSASSRSTSSAATSRSSRRTPTSLTSRTRSGSARPRELLHEGGLAGERCRVDLQPVEPRPPHPPLLHRHVARPVAIVELHEQDAAGAILVDGHRLGRAAVRPRGHAGLATLRRVPVAEREVVEVRGRDLAAVNTTSSASVLPGIASDPWIIPTCQRARPSAAASNPASGLRGARLVGKTNPWTARSRMP